MVSRPIPYKVTGCATCSQKLDDPIYLEPLASYIVQAKESCSYSVWALRRLIAQRLGITIGLSKIEPGASSQLELVLQYVLQTPIVNQSPDRKRPFQVQAAYRTAHRHLRQLSQPLAGYAEQLLSRVEQADVNFEITLISELFLQSLLEPPLLSTKSRQLLSTANIFCWMAYTVYDDFFDNEGEICFLPAANVAHRQSLLLYQQVLALQQDFQGHIQRMYNTMDQANAWEMAHCRARVHEGQLSFAALPRYGSLQVISQRALGHVIGVFGIASVLNINASQMELLQRSMHHFLVARQLNDDIHDWRVDVLRGQLSPVVSELLRAQQIYTGTVRLSELLPQLETYFWQTAHQKFCRTITWHSRRARRLLLQTKLLKDDSSFIELVKRPESIAQAGLVAHQKQKDFLTAFTR